MVEPVPPYTAVIFTSVRTEATGYDEAAERMEAMADLQPGFLGIESVRDPASRLGITVSYWADERSAVAWKMVAEHRTEQERGRTRWYERYDVRVATVHRSTHWVGQGGASGEPGAHG